MRRSGPRVSRRLLLMLMVLGLHLALLSLLQRAGGGLSAPTRAAPDAQTQRLSIPLRLLPLPAVSEPRAQRPAAAPSRAAGPAARPSLSPSPKPAAPTAQAAPVLAEATPPQAEPPASAPCPACWTARPRAAPCASLPSKRRRVRHKPWPRTRSSAWNAA